MSNRFNYATEVDFFVTKYRRWLERRFEKASLERCLLTVTDAMEELVRHLRAQKEPIVLDGMGGSVFTIVVGAGQLTGRSTEPWRKLYHIAVDCFAMAYVGTETMKQKGAPSIPPKQLLSIFELHQLGYSQAEIARE